MARYIFTKHIHMFMSRCPSTTSFPLDILLILLVCNFPCSRSLSIDMTTTSPILVVGATGGMGPRAIAGLLDVGYAPEQLRILTRRAEKAASLQSMGFQTAIADLEVPDASLDDALAGCVGCYIHSTSSDTKKLDTREVERAQNLSNAITRQSSIKELVFNSAAGEADHGVKRIQQKHDVERLLFVAHAEIAVTSLRANLFMDELWKDYTRPAILKGTFPFSVPSDRPIYLTSVRDMGRLAGKLLQRGQSNEHRILNVAGDVLTAKEMADAFAKVQGSSCKHNESKLFATIARFFFRDLYEVIRFYRESTETTDINELKEEFPGQLTSLEEFLEETNWSNPALSFKDLQDMSVCSGIATSPK